MFCTFSGGLLHQTCTFSGGLLHQTCTFSGGLFIKINIFTDYFYLKSVIVFIGSEFKSLKIDCKFLLNTLNSLLMLAQKVYFL